MIIKLEKLEKLALLKALKDGFLDTDQIPALKKLVETHAPARILTKDEAREFINKLENEH